MTFLNRVWLSRPTSEISVSQRDTYLWVKNMYATATRQSPLNRDMRTDMNGDTRIGMCMDLCQ